MHTCMLKELYQSQIQQPQVQPQIMLSKNCAPFSNIISEKNNLQVNDVHNIEIVIPMYNSIEYRDIYSKKSGRL